MHKKEHPTHKIDATNIEIIDKADNNFKLMLKEMLHIIKHKPELNTQHASQNKNEKTFKSQLNTIIIATNNNKKPISAKIINENDQVFN